MTAAQTLALNKRKHDAAAAPVRVMIIIIIVSV